MIATGNSTVSSDYYITPGTSIVPDDYNIFLQETVQFLIITTFETRTAHNCHCIIPGNSTVSYDYYITSGNSKVPDDNYVTL